MIVRGYGQPRTTSADRLAIQKFWIANYLWIFISLDNGIRLLTCVRRHYPQRDCQSDVAETATYDILINLRSMTAKRPENCRTNVVHLA